MATLEALRRALDPVLDPRSTGNATVDLFERTLAPGGVLHCDAAAGPSAKDGAVADLALSLHSYLEGSGKAPRALFATLGKVAASSPDANGAGTPGKAGGGRRALVASSASTQLPLDAFQVALTLLLSGPVPLEAQSEPLPPSSQRALDLIVQYLDLNVDGALSTDDVVTGFQRLNRAWLISKFPSTARGYDLAVQLRAEMAHGGEADTVTSWFTRSISSTSRLREMKSSGSGAAAADASLCLTNIELQKGLVKLDLWRRLGWSKTQLLELFRYLDAEQQGSMTPKGVLEAFADTENMAAALQVRVAAPGLLSDLLARTKPLRSTMGAVCELLDPYAAGSFSTTETSVALAKLLGMPERVANSPASTIASPRSTTTMAQISRLTPSKGAAPSSAATAAGALPVTATTQRARELARNAAAVAKIHKDQPKPAVTSEDVDKIRHKLFGAAYTAGGKDYTLLFKRIDKDHNGVLDRTEFEDLCRRVLKVAPTEVSAEELSILFNVLDLDGDQNIDLEELLAFVHDGHGWSGYDDPRVSAVTSADSASGPYSHATPHAPHTDAASLGDALVSIKGSSDLNIFREAFAALAKNDAEAKVARKKAWNAADPNGNGYLSVAEFDAWIKRTLLHSGRLTPYEADRTWRLFRPCYLRAHHDAADALATKKVGGTMGASTDDYVQKGEFRLANAYLCIYAGMLDAFNAVDGNDGGDGGTPVADDRRIGMAEWRAACANGGAGVSGRGLRGLDDVVRALAEVEDGGRTGVGQRTFDDVVETAFHEMDGDGKGMVLLGEWCEYLKQKEIGNGAEATSTPLGALLSVGDTEFSKAKNRGFTTRLAGREDSSLKGSAISPDHVSSKALDWYQGHVKELARSGSEELQKLKEKTQYVVPPIVYPVGAGTAGATSSPAAAVALAAGSPTAGASVRMLDTSASVASVSSPTASGRAKSPNARMKGLKVGSSLTGVRQIDSVIQAKLSALRERLAKDVEALELEAEAAVAEAIATEELRASDPTFDVTATRRGSSNGSELVVEQKLQDGLRDKWEKSLEFTGKALSELEYQIREKEDAAIRLEVRIQDKGKSLKAIQSTNQVLGNYLQQLEARLALYKPDGAN